MLDGGPIVVDFSDVSIDSEGHILICDHLLDLVEYELFFNKLAAADKVVIKSLLQNGFWIGSLISLTEREFIIEEGQLFI